MQLTRTLRLCAPLAFLLAASPVLAQAPSDPLWPCVQPKVATLAVGQMWSGPPIDNLKWREDRQVVDVVPLLIARRTPLEQADTLIGDFATQAGAAKKERLTLLFAGVFDEINGLRTRILAGIERYSKHQIALSDRIKEESLQLSKAKKADATDEEKAKVADLEKQVVWDTRIYDTRAQAVNAVCESPTILEQRAFALSRTIQNAMQ